MDNKKNIILRILLYIFSFLIIFVGIYFFSEGNVLWFLITSILTFSIYTFLIAKNYKVLSPLSSVTFLLISLLLLGLSSNSQMGAFENHTNEKIFMITFALIELFYIIIGVVWYTKERVWKKVLAVIFIFLSNFLLLSFTIVLPSFYQNFVYTRLYILISFLFSIFLIIKGNVVFRILGILGIFVCVGSLLISAIILTEEVYVLEGEDKQEVIEFVDEKAKEMLSYYNEDMFEQEEFCKYCGPTLISMMYSDPRNLLTIKETYGDYMSIGEPTVTRSVGIFYVEYPVVFENMEGTKYVVFALEGITPDYGIYGFAITNALGEY